MTKRLLENAADVRQAAERACGAVQLCLGEAKRALRAGESPIIVNEHLDHAIRNAAETDRHLRRLALRIRPLAHLKSKERGMQ